MAELKDYLSPNKPTWCPGCGNFGIWNALKNALVNRNIKPHEILIVSGIGCGSKLPDYTRANGLMTLHGRPLPAATGAYLANHDLKIILTHGDGDGFSMGGNHFIHAIRRNIDVVDIYQDNKVYGLTKGQYSPTSEKGFVSKTSQRGSIEESVKPISLALGQGATFVSRGFAGDIDHLVWLIEQALDHRGYSLVDVFQPCVSFNKVNTYQFYQQRIYKLQDEEDYDITNRELAFKKSLEWGDRIPIGIFYKEEGKPTYADELVPLKEKPLVKQELGALISESLKSEFM
ncbi:2-oxoacid:ferredoxin oxidoreductase subunit beta [candidate division KSB1 bacterium]|nr:2-oxoacid:ferredoxin oxidoreductase subunit beta [candidate division KSB1 bacterium]